jgi:hypothetical protein
VSETHWDRLVSTALVGTERKPVPPAVVDAVGALVGGDLAAGSQELVLLTAAGVLASFRRAGIVTDRRTPVPRPAAVVDDRPEPSPGAVQLLELLVDGQSGVAGSTSGLIAGWLRRCASTGRQVPAALLPRLLSAATIEAQIRPALLEAGGPRLTWLAAHNDAWAWAVDDPTAEPTDTDVLAQAWTTGTGDSRFSALGALRTIDPAAAVELLAATWSGERANDRARALGALRAGLGPGDEAFLEAALDDRAASVRTAAAGLLAALAGSRLGQRMATRLRPLVRGRGSLRKRLEVDFPPEPDAAARRDGIVDAGAPAGTGPRAWWLIQLVAATPLSFWSDELGLPPGEVLALASQREVHDGLARAAVAQPGSAPWAIELLRVRPEAPLLQVLAPEQARAALPSVLAQCKDPAVPAALASVPGPWSAALSGAVVTRLRALKNVVAVEAALPHLAAAAEPSIAPMLQEWISATRDDDRRRRLVRQVAHAVSIRHAIAQELT